MLRLRFRSYRLRFTKVSKTSELYRLKYDLSLKQKPFQIRWFSEKTDSDDKVDSIAELKTKVRERINIHSHLFTEDEEKKNLLDSFIRVNHAGEFGAQRIYEGQMAIFKGTDVYPVIKKMADQETIHLETFNRLLDERRVRPTLLFPVWNMVGYGAGFASALLGKEAAMAMTVAVEEVIGEHYNNQLRVMNEMNYTESKEDQELKQTIRTFRDDELEHLDTGLQHDAQKTPFYEVFTSAIKAGTRAAIWLSERI
jgi:ubiquinone biosynthesis monooxygenase Coq7